MRTALSRCLLCLVVSAASPSAVPTELKLKEADHKKLSKLVNEYYDAREEEKGIQEALGKILSTIEDTNKRLKHDELLAAVSDWEQVFWYVQLERLKEDLRSKGKVDEIKTRHGNGMDVAFAYSLPKTYLAKKGPYPLVLTVPDEGEKPAAHLDAHWNDPALREAALLVAVSMPSDVSLWGTFGTPDRPGGAFSVMNAFGVVQQRLAIDSNRVFLAGAGKGFGAAGVTAATFPQFFAGLIGLGDVPEVDPANFRSLPTLLVKGAAGATAIEAKVKELGFENSTLLSDGGAAEVWAWMGQTKRDPYPARVSFSPTSDYARRAHWISIEGFEISESPHVEATIDREANTITIDAQKVSEVVVYLNDVLVDLAKPVKLVFNGTTHEEHVQRNAPEMINIQRSNGDWGRVLTGYVKLP